MEGNQREALGGSSDPAEETRVLLETQRTPAHGTPTELPLALDYRDHLSGHNVRPGDVEMNAIRLSDQRLHAVNGDVICVPTVIRDRPQDIDVVNAGDLPRRALQGDV